MLKKYVDFIQNMGYNEDAKREKAPGAGSALYLRGTLKKWLEASPMYSESENQYSDRPSQLIWKLSRAEYQKFFCTRSFSSGGLERWKVMGVSSGNGRGISDENDNNRKMSELRRINGSSAQQKNGWFTLTVLYRSEII